MLNCRDLLELGSAYLDADLSPRDAWAARMHLLICGNCRAYLRQLKLAIDTVGELETSPTREADVHIILSRVLAAKTQGPCG